MSKIDLPNNENTDRMIDSLKLALQTSDEWTRHERARRILWKAQFETGGAFWMDLDTSHVFGEAKNCFVEGHYIATIVLATGFMEHILADLLNTGGKENLQCLIDMAKERKLLTPDLLRGLDELKEIRNPFVHRKQPKPEAQKHTLGQRSVGANKHPQAVLEADAKKALSLMYAYFHHVVG